MEKYILIRSVSASAIKDKGAPVEPSEEGLSEILGEYDTRPKAVAEMAKRATAEFSQKERISVEHLSINSSTCYSGDEEGSYECDSAEIELHPGESADALKQVHYEIVKRDIPERYLAIEVVTSDENYDYDTVVTEGPFNTLEESIKAVSKMVKDEIEGRNCAKRFDNAMNGTALADGTSCAQYEWEEESMTFRFFIKAL